MGHRRGFGYWGVVVGVVLAVGLFAFVIWSARSSGTTGTATISTLKGTKPTSPPTGAASLNMDTCGCPSGSSATPVCQTQRSWTIEKQYMGGNSAESDTENPVKSAKFNITVTSVDKPVVEGTYDIVLTNSGVPSTYLTSVVVSLEQSVAQGGDAIGPSGKNWKVIATAMLSASNSQCNTKSPMIARVCDTTTGATVSATPGSTLVVLNGNGTSIAGLETVPINQAIADDDGNGIVDSGDGTNACGGGNRTVDDDNDGLIDEEGICNDAVHFLVQYSLALTPAQVASLSNQSVRINVLSTFLTVGERGATCQADVNCDDVISAAEKNVRTVQQRQPFTFPTACPLQCQCVIATDTPSILYDDFATYPPPFVPFMYDTYGDNAPYSPVVCGNTTFFVNVSATCPVGPGLILFKNKAKLTPPPNSQCSTVFGTSLILQAEAIAQTGAYNCPVGVPTSSVASPTPTPTPALPPVDQPPPDGTVCTYSAGGLSFDKTCNPVVTDAICTDRRTNSQASAHCLMQRCLDIFPSPNFTVGNGVDTSVYSRVVLSNANRATLSKMVARFIAANTGPSSYLKEDAFFSTLLPVADYQVSARQTARQLTAAMINRAFVYIYDNASMIEIHDAMVFKGDCGVVPAAFDGVSVTRTISFLACAIGLPHESSLMDTTAEAIAHCSAKCGIYSDLCELVYTNYPAETGFVNGSYLMNVLQQLMELYNTNSEGCTSVSPCIVIPASFYNTKRAIAA